MRPDVSASRRTGDISGVGRYSYRADGHLARMLRMFVRRNELRRSSDRIEGLVVGLLLASFAAAVVIAAAFAAHIYQSEQTQAADLRPGVAVLSWPGAI